MDDLPKVGEKLVIVNEFGKKLLVALHNVKNAYQTDGQRPIILGDAGLQPVFKAIAKKFPDLGPLGQVQGSNVFDSNHRSFLETIAEGYECLLGVVDFRDGALHVLSDCNRLVNLSVDLNPEVTQLFLRLLISYIRVNLLVSFFTDRKLVAAIYARSYFTANATTEPHYTRIAKYLTEFENPIEKMQEDLFGLGARVGQVLGLLKQNFDRAFPVTDVLFNEGPLNTIHNAANIAKPSEEGKRLGDLAKPNEITEWILFGLLVCPSELSKPTGVELLKAALQKGFSYEIFRDDLINFHQEYEAMFSSYKGNVKQAKAALGETSTAMVNSGPTFHQDRRQFLRLQLFQTHELLVEKPSLVVPKLSLILAALSMAKEEILWYFRHFEKAAPKSSKAKFKEDDNKDMQITELLFLVHEIKKIVLSQKQAIQTYYLEYLGGYYKTKVQQLVEQTAQTSRFDEKMKAHFDYLIDALSRVSPSQPNVDFESLRLNWIRLQVFFSLPTSSISPATAGPLISLLSELSARTLYVDRLEERVEAAAGLEALYFEKAAFITSFGLAQKHVAQSKFSGSFINIAQTFLANISPYYPKESLVIGPKATQLLETLYGDVTKRIADLLHEASLTVRDYSMKSEADQGALAAAKDRETKEKEKEKSRKPGIVTDADSNTPGAESMMRSNNEIKKLNGRKQLIKNLSHAMCGLESITFYDTIFYPRQFLLEAIYNRVRGFIAGVVKLETTPEDPNPVIPVKRPSLALAEVEAYIMATLTIESAVNIGVPAILRDILLDQVDLEGSRKLTKSNQTDAQPAKIKAKKSSDLNRLLSSSNESPILFTYLKWYVEYVLAQATAGNFVYSPLRKAFVSKISSGLKIERYTSLSELVALCRLVGPNGLKYVEERIMRQVTTIVGEIKEMIILNTEVLSGIRDNWQIETRCSDLQKRLKNIEGLYSKTISLGVTFAFRGLFADALSHVLASKVDHLFNCISNAHKQYPANTYGVAGYAVIDEVANWAGIFDNVDVALRHSLEVHCHDPASDRKVWDLLPYLYGVTCASLSNLDGTFFNIAILNNENNAICLALALNKLTVSLMSLVSSSSEKEAIANYQRTFLDVASTCVLRLNKEKPKELESVAIILAEFAESSKFLTLDIFDDRLPYSYIRNAFGEAFRRRGKKKGDDF